MAFIFAASTSLRAQRFAPDFHGPPAGHESRPPHHIAPALTRGPRGYSPAQMRHAYGIDQIGNQGEGQTIGIVVAYGSPTLQSDLDQFCAQYKIASTTVKIIYPQGQPLRYDDGWAMETTLDVEWAHAIAPKASIVVAVARNSTTKSLLKAVDAAVAAGAKQISMSWGGSEFPSEVYADAHFNVAGVTFLAASGDDGAGAIWPACSPFVIGVGGTTLHLDASGNVISETAWNGSGGGISQYEDEPDFQNPWQSSGGRAVPDVSYNANPNTGVPIYFTGQNAGSWITIGGTSAGTPQWAALIALANAARGASLDDALTPIYSAADSNYAHDFRDVTRGQNGYRAKRLFDLVTGLGSPKANALVPALSLY